MRVQALPFNRACLTHFLPICSVVYNCCNLSSPDGGNTVQSSLAAAAVNCRDGTVQQSDYFSSGMEEGRKDVIQAFERVPLTEGS